MNEALLETLRLAQRLGFFGAAPVEAAAEHALGYVHALGPLEPGCRIADLGSGGGLPGLVIADAVPHCTVVLIDRRTKRTDFLQRAIVRLGLTNATVRAADADDVVRDVRSGTVPPFDAVTARGFGPPEYTLRTAVALLDHSGRAVISEPPSGDRWDQDLLAELGVHTDRQGVVRVFQRFM